MKMHNISRLTRLTRVALWAAAAAVTLNVAPSAGAQECENPDALRFSIIPTEETIQELTLYKPVVDYLAKQTGK